MLLLAQMGPIVQEPCRLLPCKCIFQTARCEDSHLQCCFGRNDALLPFCFLLLSLAAAGYGTPPEREAFPADVLAEVAHE